MNPSVILSGAVYIGGPFLAAIILAWLLAPAIAKMVSINIAGARILVFLVTLLSSFVLLSLVKAI